MASKTATRSKSDRFKKVSLIAGLAAMIGAAGIRNVLANTFLTVAGPLTAAGFVYEVQAMRHAQLAYEAADRAKYAASLEGQSGPSESRERVTPAVLRDNDIAILGGKLEAMIKSHAVLLDTFGDDASSVAPVYAVIIGQMLRDDERAFEAVSEKRGSASPEDAIKLSEQEGRLRDIHIKMARLMSH